MPGTEFQRWRTILRIHHALVHLSNGHSVTDTAIRVWLVQPTSFIEAFTTVVGERQAARWPRSKPWIR
ncbi:hypothetical protein GCM10009765_82650 [Fodinicola feengrottensis]|uniref:HTH araC/xylS-type domain-containing protein n=1 Tax=Fodinicola feengrottensis TaxID=435914 RepID=A0ABN2JBR6_9ACTN